jgi:hypothetical protein
MDESGQHAVAVEIERYDSDEGLEAMFERSYEWIEMFRNATEQQSIETQGAEYDTGTCNIGTHGTYSSSSPADDPDTSRTQLIFMTSNNELVTINVRDEPGKDLDEAIRIAEIVEDRL